jgi:Lrp/AsnC family leucine-responsive transcriptional regulator
MDFDRIDRQILAELQREGRLTNAALAERLHLSASACLRRVQRLEEDGVIAGYHARLNASRIGRATEVLAQVSLTSQREEALDEFERAVRDCPDVRECQLLSGGADYLLRVAFAGTQEYEQFHKQVLARLPHVARIQTSFVLRTVTRREGFEF